MMASMAKVIGLVTFFNLLALVNLVKVDDLEGSRSKMMEMEGMEKIKQMEKLEMVPVEKIKQMEKILMEARHFPHSSVTRDEIENKMEKLVKMEARHFPHSSVTRHTSAHTRLPQKGVYVPNADPILESALSSLISQLALTCTEEKSYRAYKLPLSCPAHLPLLTACHCLAKDNRGQLLKKSTGNIGVKGCECSISSSPWSHVVTRASCCSTGKPEGIPSKKGPVIAALMAEESAELIRCPREAPTVTRYRSSRGVIECGEGNLVGRCLCLRDTGRSLGRAVGSACICSEGGIARAVCCGEAGGPIHDFVLVQK